MADYTLVATILGSVLVALLTFILNGWRERTFERRKTNYGFKLHAFQEMAQISSRLCRLYGRFVLIVPQLSSPREVRMKREAVGQLVVSLHELSAMELHGQLRPSEDCVALSNRYVLDPKSLTSADFDRLELGVYDGYLAAMAFYIYELIDRTWVTRLVAESEEVSVASALVLDKAIKMSDAVTSALENPKAPSILSQLELEPQVARLHLAMRRELDATMISGSSRLLRRHDGLAR